MLWNNLTLPDNPYYQDDSVLIYCADCRDILPLIPDKSIDLVLTDPPYGVDIGSGDKRSGHGLHKGSFDGYEDNEINFKNSILPIIKELIDSKNRVIVFPGSNRISDYPPADTLGGIHCKAAVGRSRWGFTNFIPILFYGSNPNQCFGCYPNVLDSVEIADNNGHPTPKPVGWINWLINFGSREDDLILDPFLGSGTTAYCAKKLGRKCIGIEISEKYCEISAKRCSQTVMNLEIESKPEVKQEALI